MRLTVVSKGIRIPKALLDKYQIKDAVDVELRDDALLLKPVRQGWEKQFRQAIVAGDVPEGEWLEGFSNDFDDKDWTWS